MGKIVGLLAVQAISVIAGTLSLLMMWNLAVFHAFPGVVPALSLKQALILDLCFGLLHPHPILTNELKSMPWEKLAWDCFGTSMARFLTYSVVSIAIYLKWYA